MLKEKNEIKVDGSYSREGFTCLHLAAATGFIKLAELLLKKGANLAKKSKNDERIMPLELAIENKKDETGELLVKKMTRDR